MSVILDQPRSWEIWLKHAQSYEKAAGGRTGKPSPFTPTIQYNLIALALEGYVMAMAAYHRTLPENHTFTDLIRAWEAVAPLEPWLKAAILKYEDMQSICSLEAYQRRDPAPEEIAELRAAVTELGLIVKKTCLLDSPVAEVKP
ncbi:MAG: hypothetical protein HGA76_10180 [Candidatus Firestonebacteria bacterium]|nr:hypothetical protein [Candidatus Firestonebacteria bacterium]